MKIMNVFLFCILIIFGCSYYFPISINNQDEFIASFDDCRISFETSGFMYDHIILYQKFETDSKITINSDSLEIQYNGKENILDYYVELDGRDESSNKIESTYEINDTTNLSLVIKMRGAFDPDFDTKDTVVIKTDGYIYCNEKRLDIGDIRLTLKE